jgi:hypothetical protein
VRPKTKNREMNMNPVHISTRGYCHEIRDLHDEHLPRSKKKLKAGTSSHHLRSFEQDKQKDLPPSPTPELSLRPKTFRKLPMISPRIKINIGTDVSRK